MDQRSHSEIEKKSNRKETSRRTQGYNNEQYGQAASTLSASSFGSKENYLDDLRPLAKYMMTGNPKDLERDNRVSTETESRPSPSYGQRDQAGPGYPSDILEKRSTQIKNFVCHIAENGENHHPIENYTSNPTITEGEYSNVINSRYYREWTPERKKNVRDVLRKFME